MNYSVSGWRISSGTAVSSPLTLEHHLTVNARWDKQEVLKKRPMHLTHSNPPPPQQTHTHTHSPPRLDLSQDQYAAGARCCTIPRRGIEGF